MCIVRLLECIHSLYEIAYEDSMGDADGNMKPYTTLNASLPSASMNTRYIGRVVEYVRGVYHLAEDAPNASSSCASVNAEQCG